LFTILAEAKKAQSISSIVSEVERPRFINEWVVDETRFLITTEFEDSEIEEVWRFDIEQNVPNPWDDMTTIVITSGVESVASVAIMNSVGQVQYRSEINIVVGENELVIYPESLAGNGVYYYTIEMNGQTRMKKMILLR